MFGPITFQKALLFAQFVNLTLDLKKRLFSKFVDDGSVTTKKIMLDGISNIV